jgi:hypothetical protein
MRKLVQPPLSLHCDLSDGEPRLKLIEPADSVLDLDAEIFVSPKYGHEQSHMVPHDHYSRPYGVFFDDPPNSIVGLERVKMVGDKAWRAASNF